MSPRPLRYLVVALIAVTLLSWAPLGEHSSRGAPSVGVSSGFGGSVTPTAEPPDPYSNGMAASVVLGASNFTSTGFTATPNASAMRGDPEWATVDAHGNLWSTDFSDGRVLEFPAPFTNGEAASLVIGQSSFTGDTPGTTATNLTGPAAVAFDSAGDLWVSDFFNCRILEYLAPLAIGESASLVLGQTTFTTATCGAGSTGLDGPTGLSFDPQGDLLVADAHNSRVLEYHPPFSSGMAASVVIGQSIFTGSAPGLTATNLSYPVDVKEAGGVLWVADLSNARVLGYSAPITTGEAAFDVLGQPDFVTSTATGPDSLSGPTGVSIDAQGHLWVSDQGQSRVVEFASDPSTYAPPIAVIGQSNLAGDAPGTTATNLSGPIGVDAAPNSLWVTDAENDRILEYVPSVFSVHVDETGLPSGTPWTAVLNNETSSGSSNSIAFSIENGSYPLYVPPVPGFTADPSVSFVTVNGTAATFAVAFSPASPNPYFTGMPASVAIGQSDLWGDTGPPTSFANGSSFRDPGYAIAFDGSGDLWVADWGSNRVVEFVPPLTTGMTASLVLGQSSLSGWQPGTTSTNLSQPDGLAFDAHGNLWVSEFGNNRIVEFPAPFTSGEAATIVLGQSSFTTNTPGAGPAGLNGPGMIAWHNGTLWAADYRNNRVVGFPSPLTSSENATIVLGQTDFNGTFANTTAVNLSLPATVAFDSRGDLWVADYGNNRAVEFASPIMTGEAASIVLGQTNFTTLNTTGLSAIYEDNGVSVDSTGNVWVADSGDNRVLEFVGPTFSDNQSASIVLGQGNLSGFQPSSGPSGLYYATFVTQDSHGNLWVDDESNFRVLGYVPAQYRVTYHATGASLPTSWNLTLNGVASTVTGNSSSLVTFNGTVVWNASAPGWSLTPNHGAQLVNGADIQVNLSFVRTTYSVTFAESGLSVGTNWSVTVAGETQYSTGTTIVFSETNGTFNYTISTPSGYNAPSPSSGDVQVRAGPTTVSVTFTSSSSGSSLWLYIAIGVVIVVVAVAVLLLVRRRKGRAGTGAASSPPTPWSGPSGGAPPSSSGEPSPPPPPPPAGGAPPGAT